MPRRERAKGVAGEREVAAFYELAGYQVRGLEGAGDHLIVVDAAITLHSEVKRHEVLRIPTWTRQAELEAPIGTIPVVHFRQNRDRWYVVLALDNFVRLLPAPAGRHSLAAGVHEQLDEGVR